MFIQHSAFLTTGLIVILAAQTGVPTAQGGQADEALQAAKSATRFMTDSVSTHGGYLWRYSADLSQREGEGVVKTETVWVQPPGTPAVGATFVRLYQATEDQQFLDAALATAEALRLGQMRSGGWQALIEFEPARRKKWAYRTDPPRSKAKDQSSLDDDKTQSAIRFLIHLDQATGLKNQSVHEMTMFALDGLIEKGQFSNGGFPQVWTGSSGESKESQSSAARYPDSWPRQYPGHQQYWNQYTLNDNLASDVMRTLFLADDVYDDPRYQAAALRLADSLLMTQMPMPQPAWAQQYNQSLEPIWARKFEPPAITGGESQSVIRTLMQVYRRTGKIKYLDAVGPALDYLQASELPDGRLARFYELKTNRPLYFTRDYKLTYDDSDCPTHYSFKISSKLKRLRAQYEKLRKQTWTPPLNRSSSRSEKTEPVYSKHIQKLIDNQDQHGAWVTDTGLRYQKHDGSVIDMAVMVRNLNTIANYLGAANQE